MARVGEFCTSNIVRFLLGVFIAVVLVLAVGVWFFYSPGHGSSIEDQHHRTKPNQPPQ
jgi:uncharacterized membrane protein